LHLWHDRLAHNLTIRKPADHETPFRLVDDFDAYWLALGHQSAGASGGASELGNLAALTALAVA
jgi:hypothetical protein